MLDSHAMFWKGAWESFRYAPKFLIAFWPVWLMLGLKYGVQFAFRYFEQRRLTASGIAEIDGMDGRTFEKYLENLFNRLGYRVERTRYVGDYGADLVTRKDGVRTVIQAKRYKSKVGIKAVQEAVASKGYYDCTVAMVVTNSTYTKQAVELARVNGVVLWDRERLVEALLSVQRVPEASAAPAVSVAAPLEEPVAVPIEEQPQPVLVDRCAHCGGPVAEKVRDYCRTHSERFHGEIYCYEHQRAARRLVAAGEGRE